MSDDLVRRIADAVLYEGYILWPYRRSALKNRRRWTFGGVYPRAHARVHPDDAWTMRAECLLEGHRSAAPEDVEQARGGRVQVIARCIKRWHGDPAAGTQRITDAP